MLLPHESRTRLGILAFDGQTTSQHRYNDLRVQYAGSGGEAACEPWSLLRLNHRYPRGMLCKGQTRYFLIFRSRSNGAM
jgi:hypothetical protein